MHWRSVLERTCFSTVWSSFTIECNAAAGLTLASSWQAKRLTETAMSQTISTAGSHVVSTS
jgi:hypothetical protein